MAENNQDIDYSKIQPREAFFDSRFNNYFCFDENKQFYIANGDNWIPSEDPNTLYQNQSQQSQFAQEAQAIDDEKDSMRAKVNARLAAKRQREEEEEAQRRAQQEAANRRTRELAEAQAKERALLEQQKRAEQEKLAAEQRERELQAAQEQARLAAEQKAKEEQAAAQRAAELAQQQAEQERLAAEQAKRRADELAAKQQAEELEKQRQAELQKQIELEEQALARQRAEQQAKELAEQQVQQKQAQDELAAQLAREQAELEAAKLRQIEAAQQASQPTPVQEEMVTIDFDAQNIFEGIKVLVQKNKLTKKYQTLSEFLGLPKISVNANLTPGRFEIIYFQTQPGEPVFQRPEKFNTLTLNKPQFEIKVHALDDSVAIQKALLLFAFTANYPHYVYKNDIHSQTDRLINWLWYAAQMLIETPSQEYTNCPCVISYLPSQLNSSEYYLNQYNQWQKGDSVGATPETINQPLHEGYLAWVGATAQENKTLDTTQRLQNIMEEVGIKDEVQEIINDEIKPEEKVDIFQTQLKPIKIDVSSFFDIKQWR